MTQTIEKRIKDHWKKLLIGVRNGAAITPILEVELPELAHQLLSEANDGNIVYLKGRGWLSHAAYQDLIRHEERQRLIGVVEQLETFQMLETIEDPHDTASWRTVVDRDEVLATLNKEKD